MDSIANFLVTVDPALETAISLVLTAVFSFLILQLTASVPWLAEYLGQHRVAVVTWLTGIMVQLLQSVLDRVPATWDDILVLVMKLIAQVVVVLLGFAFWKHKQVKGHAAL